MLIESSKLALPELVLFDLDGTLVDSIPDLANAVNKTLAEFSIARRDLKDIRDWVGNGIEKLLHRAISNDINGEADTELFQQVLPKFKTFYQQNVCVLTCCYDGVMEGINFLKQQGVKLGCVTNKSAEFVSPILEKIGLFGDMDVVVAGDTLARKKPDPLPLIHAASTLGVDFDEVLMIGDSVSDLKAARAAKFQIVCVSYGYNQGQDLLAMKPDAFIDSLAELPQLFHSVNYD